MGEQVRRLELVIVRKEAIVHLPEGALRCCGLGCFGGQVGRIDKAVLWATNVTDRVDRQRGQEIAVFTSSTTFFSTTGLHFRSAYDTGHRSPSSRLAAS